MDHEAVEVDMDQEAVEGAVDGASDERSDRWNKKQSKEIWMRKLKERWMLQAMEGAMDGTSDGSRSSRTNVLAMSRRSDRWYKRLITKQSKEIWIRKLSKERSGCCRSKHRCNWKEAYDDDSDDDHRMFIE